MSVTENLISVFALGGLNEIGKNMYAIEYSNDIVIIDCGNKFPDESLLGIDLIIPDITYLIENKDRVRALIVTHGHEDHIGGIPFFLKRLNVPVYATRFTLGLIEIKLKEHKLLRESELLEINSHSKLKFGKMGVSFFKVTHSIPDCLGIVFQTPLGNIVHTGDFKFDLTPVNNQHSDIHKMAEIGNEGVLLLLSESTNAERPGLTPSEQTIGEQLDAAFMKAERKVIISTFASNISRVQQIVNAAQKTNRKIALLGRSMVNVVAVAIERGYLTVPDGMLIDQNEINELPPEKVAILCTGSQGEPLAALARLSTGNFRGIDILPKDTVIFAAGPIPGNERNVTSIIDNLYALGATVIYGSGSSSRIHVSGHGYQEDLKLMLTLMNPKYFIPIHGELRMLHHHRLLAESIGVDRGNTFIMNNGDVVDIEHGIARQTRNIPVGNTYVDGGEIGNVGGFVLRDRKQFSEDGMLIIVLTMSKAEGKLLSEPETISRGFIDSDFSELRRNLNQLTTKIVNELQEENRNQWNVLKREIKKSIQQRVFNQMKRKPMIVPILIEI
ncbi:RNA-metabolising metallo-beta-lactamase [Neobacillus bataviensis LMG 21833]|uniref:Ribonuclease J n=1 Tax=Neobacillus bataviensis LMG 21833 TaxID=1117379 RepID=K6D927_9BACI|nr:ribonuclease J [Neobacillus bataviensis]EKN64834.1 RNA-metabolising metallo-beta-lactamase [Neobacillus bataviensis LMG 21833]